MSTAVAAGIINAMVMRSELFGISWYIKCIGVWREREMEMASIYVRLFPLGE
jgi:hypothetical protein